MSDPGNPTKRSDWKVVLQFIGVALILHLAAWPLLELMLPKPEPFDPSKVKPRRIRLVASKNSAKRIKLPKSKKDELEKEEPNKTPEEKKEELELANKQVVDIPPMASDEAPEDYDFVSEFNTKVERQTVSRNRQPPQEHVTNEALRSESGVDAPVKAPELAVNKSKGTQDTNQDAKQRKQELLMPEQKARDKLALNIDPEGRFKNRNKRENLLGEGKDLKLSLDGEEKSEQEGKRSTSPLQSSTNRLVPTIGELARIAGAPMNDHIEGVDEGDGTFLNTREFKYASFFNRMKRGIAQHWHPNPEIRRRDPTGNIFGVRRRTTVLEVTLNADGALEQVEVQQSSGLDFLDQVAISAMRSAQPFPNPPKGMMNEDGNIVFGFGFTLDFNGRGARLPF